MRQAGQATYFNAAFHFPRIYNFIFHRISPEATRLQEILADRVAAQTYGATAFQNGLTHVIDPPRDGDPYRRESCLLSGIN